MEKSLKSKEKIKASVIVKIDGKEYSFDECKVFANDEKEKDIVVYLQSKNDDVIQVTFNKQD